MIGQQFTSVDQSLLAHSLGEQKNKHESRTVGMKERHTYLDGCLPWVMFLGVKQPWGIFHSASDSNVNLAVEWKIQATLWWIQVYLYVERT